MSSLTTLKKYGNSGVQWLASEINNGDIIDVYTSLGGRCAKSIIIESLSGTTTLRFNVIDRIFKEHQETHNNFVGLGQGGVNSSPYQVSEHEKLGLPNIVLDADTTYTFTSADISVYDIKIVSKASGLKITIT